LNAIGDSLNDLASSAEQENGDDKDDYKGDTGHGKLSEDDEPGWVIGTISRSQQHHMESFRQNRMRLDTRTQPGWENPSD
jgi:hypothetical protein